MAETRQHDPQPLVFRRRHRLSRATEFSEAYRRGLRRSAGPITVYVLPTDHPEHRLGLSIGRRVGNAVARNRLKRLLREAFRHARPSFPAPISGAYDLVITARAHRPLPLADYQRLLADLVARAHRDLAPRPDRSADGPE